MKPPRRPEQSNGHLPVPLSEDVELRPRGASPASLGRLLGPRVDGYLHALDDNLREMERLARESSDPVTEAAIRSKLGDLIVRVATLAKDALVSSTPYARRPMSQEDLPDFSGITPETQRKLSDALDAVTRELGPGWADSRRSDWPK